MGEVILATTKMARVIDVRPGRITVEPGVTIAAMQERLTEAGAWYPPAPTFTGACAGGDRRHERGRRGDVQVRQHAQTGSMR